MYLPQLQTELQRTTQKTVEFKGINYTNMAQDGEMRDSLNISTDNYPTLSPRKARTVVQDSLTSPTDIFSVNGKLGWIDGTSFVYDGVTKGTVTAGEHYLRVITNRIVIFPDKKIYNATTDTFENMEASFTVSGKIEFLIATNDPSEDQTMTITGASNLQNTFRAGDVIHIENGTVVPANNKAVIIKAVEGNVITVETSTFVAPPRDETTPTPTTDSQGHKVYTHSSGLIVVKTSDGATTIKEYYNEPYSSSGTHVKMSREVPDLKFICEYGNRIWGVKDNTIYGSKLGDPFNFDYYNGLATDSYTVEVGSQGEFTGVFPYSNQLVFFKENYIHKLFGAKPSAFNIMTSYAEGVKEGCHKSLAIISDTIFYLSKSGVMAYTGNLPELVSQNFGVRSFQNAVGCDNNFKYAVCLEDEIGNWQFMEYDTRRAIWLKVNNEHVTGMVYHDRHLHCVVGNKIYSNDHGEINEVFQWYREFAETNENTLYQKGYSKLYVDAKGDPNAHFSISIKENEKDWRVVYMGNFTKRRAIKIPIIVGGNDLLQLRIDGEGYVKIHSLAREVTIKGDVRGNRYGIYNE